MIFNKDIIWDGKSILYTNDDIKELDDIIIQIKIPELRVLEMEDIYLVEDSEVEESIPTIILQADHKDKAHDMNPEELEQSVKDSIE